MARPDERLYVMITMGADRQEGREIHVGGGMSPDHVLCVYFSAFYKRKLFVVSKNLISRKIGTN
jgi:hypothetical protein